MTLKPNISSGTVEQVGVQTKQFKPINKLINQ